MRTKHKTIATKKIKNKGGRPTKYKTTFPKIAYKLIIKHGITNNILSDVFDVRPETISDWQNKHKEFSKAIKSAWDKHMVNGAEKSLMQRAMGYEYEEVRTENITLKQGKGEDVVELPAQKKVITTKRIQPSDLALFFVLCNRLPDRWKNVQRSIVESTTKHEHKHTYDLTKLEKGELEQIKKQLGKATATNATPNTRGVGQGTRMHIA